MSWPNAFLFAGLALRLSIAILMSFFGYDRYLELDAQSFIVEAEYIATSGDFLEFSIGTSPYLNGFAVALMAIPHPLFVGCLLSCFAWWISGRLFVKSLTLLNADHRQLALFALAFALWPTAVPYTLMPLRESFQLLFINLALFGVIGLIVTSRNVYWATVAFGVAGAGILHGALLATGILIVSIAFLAKSYLSSGAVLTARSITSLLAGFAVVYLGYNLFVSEAYDLSRGTFATIENYQNGVASIYARSTYKSEVVIDGLYDALVGIPFGFFQYLAEPLPWKVQTIGDAILCIENIFRLVIISISVKMLLTVRSAHQRVALFTLLAIYLVQEFLWSLGTVNWGTSSRHHIPAMGSMLVLLAVCGYFRRPRSPLIFSDQFVGNRSARSLQMH